MTNNIKLTPEQYDAAKLELLIKIHAGQKSLTATLMYILSNGDEAKEDEYLKIYNQQLSIEAKEIYQKLFHGNGPSGMEDISQS